MGVRVVHTNVRRPVTPEQRDTLTAKYRARSVTNERGCWVWAGPANGLGYAQVSFQNVRWMIHRLMYALWREPLPADAFVCHRCDTPRCFNPEHLFLGDHTTNQRDMIAKGRHTKQKRTHCLRFGHPLSGDNLWIRSDGRRVCRACAVIKCRLELGWTIEEARSTPIIKPWERTKRRQFGKRRSLSAHQVPNAE